VQVQRAIRQKKPVVFLGWAPHPMNTQFDITYLDGGDAVFGPDFGAAKVYTAVPTDYETRCPNMGRLLNNLQFSVEIESQLMEKVLEKQDPQVVARNWLKANPAILERWLDGVTTFTGDDGLSAVRRHIGL
jgi:glycine betaine/proline transport system substrate-binding protein